MDFKMKNKLSSLMEKIFHTHKWVYYNYVPYVDESTPHGAGYRMCEECEEKQTTW